MEFKNQFIIQINYIQYKVWNLQNRNILNLIKMYKLEMKQKIGY